MAGEQRVRELPVRPGDPDAVPLERGRGRAAAAKLLPLAGEREARSSSVSGVASTRARWKRVGVSGRSAISLSLSSRIGRSCLQVDPHTGDVSYHRPPCESRLRTRARSRSRPTSSRSRCPTGPLAGAAATAGRDARRADRSAPRGRRRRPRPRRRDARPPRRRARGPAPRDRGRGQDGRARRRGAARPRAHRRPRGRAGASAGRSPGCSTRTCRCRSPSRRRRRSRASRSAGTTRRAGAASPSAASRSSGSCSSAGATGSPRRRSARARSRTGRTAPATSSNRPPNETNPERLAAEAEEIAGLARQPRDEALDRAAMAELGMGSLLAVAQGSHNEPRLIVLRYEPPSPTRPGRRPRPRRQGDHVRHRRDLAQAGAATWRT